MDEFRVGDRVNKKTGYAFPGEVRAVFTNKDGVTRLVVECEMIRGMLHIFSPEQLYKMGRVI